MIEIIGIVVGVIGIFFGVIELVSKWSKVKAWFYHKYRKVTVGNIAKESLRVHASPRRNVFTLKKLASDFNSNVSMNIAVEEDGIMLRSYDTENSPIYLFTTFPTRLLLPLPVQNGLTWEEIGESNIGFRIKATSRIVDINEKMEVPSGQFVCVRVETIFNIPTSYTGPMYTKKTMWWAHGTGPVKIKVDFSDSESCIGELLTYEVIREDSFWPMTSQNQWEFLWTLSRPNNNRNVSDSSEKISLNIISNDPFMKTYNNGIHRK